MRGRGRVSVLCAVKISNDLCTVILEMMSIGQHYERRWGVFTKKIKGLLQKFVARGLKKLSDNQNVSIFTLKKFPRAPRARLSPTRRGG